MNSKNTLELVNSYHSPTINNIELVQIWIAQTCYDSFINDLRFLKSRYSKDPVLCKWVENFSKKLYDSFYHKF